MHTQFCSVIVFISWKICKKWYLIKMTWLLIATIYSIKSWVKSMRYADVSHLIIINSTYSPRKLMRKSQHHIHFFCKYEVKKLIHQCYFVSGMWILDDENLEKGSLFKKLVNCMFFLPMLHIIEVSLFFIRSQSRNWNECSLIMK